MNYQIKSDTEYDMHPFLMGKKLHDIADDAYKLGSPWHLFQFHDTLRSTQNICLYVIQESISGEWCGFVLGSRAPDNFDIYMIAILKEYQGQGLGTKLIEYIQQEANNINASITLEVRISNDVARYVYSRCGFEEMGQIKNYYRRPKEDAIRLVWSKNKFRE